MCVILIKTQVGNLSDLCQMRVSFHAPSAVAVELMTS